MMWKRQDAVILWTDVCVEGGKVLWREKDWQNSWLLPTPWETVILQEWQIMRVFWIITKEKATKLQRWILDSKWERCIYLLWSLRRFLNFKWNITEQMLFLKKYSLTLRLLAESVTLPYQDGTRVKPRCQATAKFPASSTHRLRSLYILCMYSSLWYSLVQALRHLDTFLANSLAAE